MLEGGVTSSIPVGNHFKSCEVALSPSSGGQVDDLGDARDPFPALVAWKPNGDSGVTDGILFEIAGLG